MKKLNLIKRGYEQVKLYPGHVILGCIYIGDTQNKYVFEHNGDKEKSYVLVDKHWVEKDEGIITHKNSSSSVQVIPENSLYIDKDLEKLVRNLR